MLASVSHNPQSLNAKNCILLITSISETKRLSGPRENYMYYWTSLSLLSNKAPYKAQDLLQSPQM
jgi:hypothetical protein